MTSAKIIDFINKLEEQFPVDRWDIAGVRIWPLVRIRLFYDLFYSSVATQQRTGSHSTRWSQVVGIASRPLQLANHIRSYFVDYKNNANLCSESDVVFFSDGVSFTFVNGVWYER